MGGSFFKKKKEKKKKIDKNGIIVFSCYFFEIFSINLCYFFFANLLGFSSICLVASVPLKLT
jgi:hypothetical protein